MSNTSKSAVSAVTGSALNGGTKKSYSKPVLEELGSVMHLTQGSTSKTNDSFGTKGKN